MEYVADISERGSDTVILCCECGVPIQPNPSNMCVGCLRSHVDITEGIPKQCTLHFCKGCERYLQPPSEWVHCALESRELLSICLKKLKGLNRVKLIDATFVWTEPHSKRIKVKLTVHGEVHGGAVLQQVFIVEFTVAYQMCDECHRSEAQDYWRAMVQVRQKAENKKTFFYLEQLILKHKAHENTLGIKPSPDGLDFYFATDAHSRKMLDFINSVLPCKYQESKRLISQDIHSNIFNYKLTYSIEIVPISKNSVVCLPTVLTNYLGGISPLCLVSRVTNCIHLIDPLSAQIAEVRSTIFWRHPFASICNPKQLAEFIVMDVEVVPFKDRKIFPGQGALSSKHAIADIWLVKASELGINDSHIHTRTHLGHLLKPGDSVLGYNMSESNINDTHYEKLNADHIASIIIVKKFYPERESARKRRIWKLKHLSEDQTALRMDTGDYNEFLDELEEDASMRQNVNIFKDATKSQIAVDSNDLQDPLMPMITLEEMLDDLVIDDVEMADDVAV